VAPFTVTTKAVQALESQCLAALDLVLTVSPAACAAITVIGRTLCNDDAFASQVRQWHSDTGPEQQSGAHHAVSAEIRASDGRPGRR
jgi:hypothetical protein